MDEPDGDLSGRRVFIIAICEVTHMRPRSYTWTVGLCNEEREMNDKLPILGHMVGKASFNPVPLALRQTSDFVHRAYMYQV